MTLVAYVALVAFSTSLSVAAPTTSTRPIGRGRSLMVGYFYLRGGSKLKRLDGRQPICSAWRPCRSSRRPTTGD